jgi:DegV family protein with EDD domain
MKITLITDSTCDLHPKFLAEQGILFAPLKVLFKDKEYVDKVDLTNPEFYELMRGSKELPTTSQVNPGEFYELFSKELEAGNKVLGIFLSSALSGTYNSAVVAKDMLENENIHLIDSRTTSFALGLMVIRIKKMIDEGFSIEQIQESASKLIEQSQLYGMLDTLENLKKGGRLSAGKAVIGNMLNLKPIIEVKEGLVNVAEKARGSKKGTAWMIEQLEKAFPSKVIDEMAVAHANSQEKAADLTNLLNATFQIGKIHEIEIGSVVGTHAGEGAVGVTFFRN